MPIDFNPHFWFNNNNNISHKVVHQSFINNQPIQDTYVKTIPEIKISKKDFGTLKNGEKTELYTITNNNGASVDLSTFGATITSIKTVKSLM